jgi:hypothetical protein
MAPAHRAGRVPARDATITFLLPPGSIPQSYAVWDRDGDIAAQPFP